MKKIYTVTCFSLHDVTYTVKSTGKPTTVTTIKNERTWGWYPHRHLAEIAIMKNTTDMCEAGYYTHAVVEEYGPGLIPLGKVISWWKFKGRKKTMGFRCKAPSIWKGQDTVNMAMG